MGKEKIKELLDLLVRKSKIVFPVLVIAIVAVTVVFALKASDNRADAFASSDVSDTSESASEGNVLESVENLIANVTNESSAQPTEEPVVSEDVPLVANEDPAIYAVVESYYNAMALGDTETLLKLHDNLSEIDLLRFEQTANYLDYYTGFEVYSKPGQEEGSTWVYIYYKTRFKNHTEEFPGYQTIYVCTRGDGQLYIKNESNFTEGEIEYLKKISSQADVEDFINRVDVEFDEMLIGNPDLLEYLGELKTRINAAIGVALANLNAEQSGEGEGAGEGTPEGGTEEPVATEAPTPEPVIQYATAITTVNVRNSDSEKADKLGKVTTGTRIQVQEVQLNGWTKVVFEGKDGFIKSEYLELEESAEGMEIIGKVTATTTINVRAGASQSATKLGVLTMGESLELVEIANGWCKVIYNGQVAYVSADYVTKE